MRDIDDILDKMDQSFSAFRNAEDQLDWALESNKSITKALRHARRARNDLLKLMMEANRAALRIKNEDSA